MASNVGTNGVDAGLVNYTHLVYGLHALSVVIGIVGTALIVGAFVFGIPSIIAVVMNYVKRSDVRGTWLDSHFRWQIRTFWFALAWSIAVSLVSFLLAFVLIGFVTWPIGMLLIGLWIVYRVVRGWLALKDGRPMPVT